MLTPEEIASMLDGSRRRRRELAELVVDAVGRTVHFTLVACGRPGDGNEDLVHELVERLYRHDGKVLRAWDPQRASFRGYLGMITGRAVRRRLGRQMVVDSLADLELGDADDHDLDRQLAYRSMLEEILAWVHEQDRDTDTRRFHALFVAQRSATEVAREEALSTDAIYAWTSRFRRRLLKTFPHVVELLRETATDDAQPCYDVSAMATDVPSTRGRRP